MNSSILACNATINASDELKKLQLIATFSSSDPSFLVGNATTIASEARRSELSVTFKLSSL
jgi:hypothetical protein